MKWIILFSLIFFSCTTALACHTTNDEMLSLDELFKHFNEDGTFRVENSGIFRLIVEEQPTKNMWQSIKGLFVSDQMESFIDYCKEHFDCTDISCFIKKPALLVFSAQDTQEIKMLLEKEGCVVSTQEMIINYDMGIKPE